MSAPPDFIEVYDDAMPAELCRELVDAFEQSPHLGAGRTGAGVDPAKKNSLDLTLDELPEWHQRRQAICVVAYPRLRDYFARYHFALVGAISPTIAHPKTRQPVDLGHHNWEELGLPLIDGLVTTMYRYGRMNLQKYRREVGGYPHWHSEIFPQNQTCESLHRVLFFMFYLNDVEDGGETEFYYQRRAVKPKQGRMVVAPGGFTHTHRGNAPRSGDKYIATSWMMFQRAEVLFGTGGR